MNSTSTLNEKRQFSTQLIYGRKREAFAPRMNEFKTTERKLLA
jgi:hypothetical protein